MRLTTITLACAVALSSTLAFAHEGRHKRGVRAHQAYKESAPVRPVVSSRYLIDGPVGIRAPRVSAFPPAPPDGENCDVGDNPFIC